jgi:protein-tyrosine-phosphatase
MDRPFNVLFLCTGNSARSIMAEAILNREERRNFRAFSAGSNPKGRVHPYALDLLRKMNFDVTQFRSKSWNEFTGPDAPKLDFAFTLCDDAAAEACPVWPGQPMTAHWGLPDPAAATGKEAEVRLAFADTYRMLNNRISIFVSLPIKSLDKSNTIHAIAEASRLWTVVENMPKMPSAATAVDLGADQEKEAAILRCPDCPFNWRPEARPPCFTFELGG